MRCIYCNTQLASIEFCPGCGADVTLIKRIGRISNLLYNRGLEKATVRDLSGAIGCLQQSLKFNKENIDARNLLGLCYYETGEAVLALCEWVISKNLCPGENAAEQYIEELQSNKNQLNAINQSIRKYNQSLEYCRQDHEDMAVMQLKKVVSQNPKLVRAKQLLALLYMKHQDYDKARRLLRRAAAIDNTNTTTLRYLSEIEELTGKSTSFSRSRRYRDEEQPDDGRSTIRYVSGTETIIQPTTFRDSSTVATFINIFLGILLGGAMVWFLAIPASRQKTLDQANAAVTDANLKLASGTAQLQDLQDEIAGYQQQVQDANAERDQALAKAENYDQLLGVASLFVRGEQMAAIDAIEGLNADSLTDNAKALYDDLLSSVSDALFNEYYSSGTTAYVARDFQKAAEQLKLAVESDPDNQQRYHYDALYYLGFAYFNMGDSVNADAIFRQIMEEYPNQASQVSPYLSTSGAQTQAASQDLTQGEAAMNQNEIDILDGTQNTQNTAPAFNWADVAWTDPYTGLHYDMYGNLLG